MRYCGRGICAAEAGHAGTCAEASGWADETPLADARAAGLVARIVMQVKQLHRAPLLWQGDQA